MEYDYDWIIVGSGFGGSVSALRLAEKGYRVAVIEVGSRFEDKDFAKTAWNLRRYFWMPNIGLRGIMRMTPFKDVLVVSGSGVGGGSLGYANTLYRPRPSFYTDKQWDGLADWEKELGPHYVTAERILGVTLYRDEGPADQLLHEYAAETGADSTYSNTQVGVHFGTPGETVSDRERYYTLYTASLGSSTLICSEPLTSLAKTWQPVAQRTLTAYLLNGKQVFSPTFAI